MRTTMPEIYESTEGCIGWIDQGDIMGCEQLKRLEDQMQGSC